MERIRNLNRYQKGVLIIMAVMILAFTVAYPVTISKVGFEYMDTILVPSQEGSSTVYSGSIQWQEARFTVSEDGTVLFEHGGTTYGPYTAREDPTAVPKDDDSAKYMTSMEIYKGEEVIFRGGVREAGSVYDDATYWLYNEDGSMDFSISYTTSDGIRRDENGDPIDPVEPRVSTIVELMMGPELTHRGQWPVWFAGVLVCVLNALTILFADELFRMHLAFRIRGADQAEPTDWEIAGRYISAAVIAAMVLALFIMGLS